MEIKSYQLFPSSQRGQKDIGWLKSSFTFSFSDFYNPVKSGFGTLVAFNDDFVALEQGFGIHPHQNMEIISILLQGTMSHKDNMGYNNVITEGGVQIMSAGTGLFHEEWNVGNEIVNFLQIWIQPKIQNIKPRYQFRSFPKENRVNKLVTVVSSEEGTEHCWINQNTKISLGYFTATSLVQYKFNHVNKAVFVFAIKGDITVNTNMINQRDAIGVWNTGDIEIKAKSDTEFVIIETVINQK
ncbi:MAG: pirin family protein [Chitinophagaceae bacterium]|nr:pirin family protein [Chitinophagaceae bacterium]